MFINNSQFTSDNENRGLIVRRACIRAAEGVKAGNLMAVKVQADRNAFLDAEHSLIVLGVSSRIVTGTRAERFISSRAGHELLLSGIESLKALFFGGREAFLALKVIVEECAGGRIVRLGNFEHSLIGVRAYHRRILVENIIACTVGGAGSSPKFVYTEFRVT